MATKKTQGPFVKLHAILGMNHDQSKFEQELSSNEGHLVVASPAEAEFPPNSAPDVPISVTPAYSDKSTPLIS